MRVRRPSRSVFGAAGCLLTLSVVTGCGQMNTSADPAAQASLDAAASASAEAEDLGMTPEEMDNMADEADATEPPEPVGDGTKSSLKGFTLDSVQTDATSTAGGVMSLRIEWDSGASAQGFTNTQGKSVHLTVFSRDLSSYVHTHPVRDAEGTWSAEVPSLPAGPVRVAVNFAATNQGGELGIITLGTEITVDGAPETVPLAAPEPSVEVDGYQVTLSDELFAGSETSLELTVTKSGEAVVLEPYLESWAHVSAVDSATLGSSHLHPTQEPETGSTAPEALTLAWTPPAAGTYRFFIEFMADGNLHRADITRVVAP